MHAAIRFAVSLCALAGFVAFVGCAPLSSERTPFSSMFNPTSSDRPISLDVAGAVEVDVESFGGDVMITSDPTEPEATVQIVRRAVHGAKRHAEAKGSLEAIDYSVDIVPGDLGQQLRIRTSTTHPEPHFQRADVYINLPEVEDVFVRTRNGRVYATGIKGEVDIQTNNGNVRVMTNQRMNQPVTIRNSAGNIDYRVRGESSGAIDAYADGGEVTHRIRYGRCIIEPGTTNSRLVARFNDGSNPIRLHTVNGDIRIASVSDPQTIGAFLFE